MSMLAQGKSPKDDYMNEAKGVLDRNDETPEEIAKAFKSFASALAAPTERAESMNEKRRKALDALDGTQ